MNRLSNIKIEQIQNNLESFVIEKLMETYNMSLTDALVKFHQTATYRALRNKGTEFYLESCWYVWEKMKQELADDYDSWMLL